MNLLTDIEAAAIDSTVPITDLLRKCMVLAARLKHEEFSQWVSRELNGYADTDHLPPYRRFPRGPSLGHFSGGFGAELKNAPIPLGHLPEKVRTRITVHEASDTLAALDAMAKSEGGLRWPWPADMVAYVAEFHPMYDHYRLMDAWCPIPLGAMKGVTDSVRSRILEFVLAIQAEDPDAGESQPSAPPPLPMPSVSHIYNTTIYGGHANVGNAGPSSIGNANVISANDDRALGFRDVRVEELLAELRAQVSQLPTDDKVEAEEAIQRVELQLAKPVPDLERIEKYLHVVGTFTTTVGPIVSRLIEYLGPLLVR